MKTPIEMGEHLCKFTELSLKKEEVVEFIKH